LLNILLIPPVIFIYSFSKGRIPKDPNKQKPIGSKMAKLDQWIPQWRDRVDFEVVPVISSQEAKTKP
jgi:hypothetical protein